MKRVLIKGSGVAACCCAYLLRNRGFDVRTESVERTQLPSILLSGHAIALIRDLFEREGLLRAARQVHKRFVAWRPDAQPLALEHSAVVVSEQELLDALAVSFHNGAEAVPPDFTIFASRPLPPQTAEQHFGERHATTTQVELNGSAEPEACWMEALPDGWLFLISGHAGMGWLLSVGGPLPEMLDRSRLVSKQVRRIGGESRRFPAWPRITSPLCGGNWLACGSAGLGFDPICGDGTANAVREAILTAAVICGIAGGGDPLSLLAHYEARLTAGFQKHLELCLRYYQSAYQNPWWEREADGIRRGLQWCAARLGPNPAFRYRLRGLELQPVKWHT
jgi:flavin-dependent dehydrogenase